MKVPIGKIENFVSKDEKAKPAIKSVWYDVAGERLLATNGHMAVRVSTDVGLDDVSGMIPVEAFELARKELRLIARALDKGAVPDPWLNVVCNPDAIFIQNLLSNTTHLVVRPKLAADEKFPSVDAVFRKLSSGPTLTLSMDYLLEITKSLQMEGVSLSFWIEADDKGVVVASPLGKVIATLMPMKVEVNLDDVNKRGEPLPDPIPNEFGQRVAIAEEFMNEMSNPSAADLDAVAADESALERTGIFLTPEFAQQVQDAMHADGYTDVEVRIGSDVTAFERQ